MSRKYDRLQVVDQLRVYLEAGGKREWTSAARALDIPRTSLTSIFSGEWPSELDGLGTANGVEVSASLPSEIEQVVIELQTGPKTTTELANALNVGPSTIDTIIDTLRKSSLYDIHTDERRISIPKNPYTPNIEEIWPAGELEIKLAHASDLHIGSIYHQNTALSHFAQYAADQGCGHCLVSGDITAGNFGQRDTQEIYAYGADEQIEAACEAIPQVEGLTWLLQGGNHDYTHYKIDGVNIVRNICAQRRDCIYVGYTKSDVPLTNKLFIRLWHPGGGASYAKSYRGQKGVEALTRESLHEVITDEETTIKNYVMLQWGHVHYRDLFWHGQTIVFNPGCFQNEYLWMAEKPLIPEIAGAITTTALAQDGWGSRTEFQWLSYKPVQDDYKPVKHKNLLVEKIEPLFSISTP